MQHKILFLLGLIILFSACKNDALIQRGDTVEVAYEKAMAFFEKEDYNEAANAFETVIRIARGTEYGKDSQFYLAESYYNSRQYLLAASEYDRFISYYPQDPKREEIEFKAAMCYYHMSPRYKLDQGDTRTAIERFQLFNNRYPNSEFVSESADKIDELRNKLARKNYDAALFYKRTHRYEAATIYLDVTIDRFPESEWAEKALALQIDTFIEYADNSIEERQAERYSNAVDAYEKFLQLYPESDLRRQVENSHDDAQRKLNRISAAANSETSES